MKTIKNHLNKNLSLCLFGAVLIVVVFWVVRFNFVPSFVKNAYDGIASVFFVDSINISLLKDKYKNYERRGEKIKILIVPGHEPSYGGAIYKDLKERDMTVNIALRLKEQFEKNKRYEVILSRDEYGWNEEIVRYFDTNAASIENFVLTKKNEMKRLIKAGKVEKIMTGPYHISARADVALRLYGINKWANDNKIDMALHLHFNDYPRTKNSLPGKYKGFSIYVPEKQYSNARGSVSVAEFVFNRLNNIYSISNLPKEEKGVVEDQDLIAIGGSNSMDGVSMLIEYGYMYEPLFSTSAQREENFEKMAQQTFFGIEDFFASK